MASWYCNAQSLDVHPTQACRVFITQSWRPRRKLISASKCLMVNVETESHGKNSHKIQEQSIADDDTNFAIVQRGFDNKSKGKSLNRPFRNFCIALLSSFIGRSRCLFYKGFIYICSQKLHKKLHCSLRYWRWFNTTETRENRKRYREIENGGKNKEKSDKTVLISARYWSANLIKIMHSCTISASSLPGNYMDWQSHQKQVSRQCCAFSTMQGGLKQNEKRNAMTWTIRWDIALAHISCTMTPY